MNQFPFMKKCKHGYSSDGTCVWCENESLRKRLEAVEANINSWDSHSATDEERGVVDSFRAALKGVQE